MAQVTLLASQTVDPIPNMFNQCYFFHRPLSTAVTLDRSNQQFSLPTAGPESVNCALEVSYVLGYRKTILFVQIRNVKDLDLPVRGNHGRTIYSQRSLLWSVIKYAFFSVAKDLSLYRIGEGIFMNQ